MKLQPARTHILVRFYNPPDIIIQASAKQFDGGDRRTRAEVIAVGPDVKSCNVGDFLYLIPKPAIAPVSEDEGLIDEGHVLGVVLDDVAPLVIVE